MIYKYQYQNELERQNILNANKDKRLTEEQSILEGNFLLFSDMLLNLDNTVIQADGIDICTITILVADTEPLTLFVDGVAYSPATYPVEGKVIFQFKTMEAKLFMMDVTNNLEHCCFCIEGI